MTTIKTRLSVLIRQTSLTSAEFGFMRTFQSRSDFRSLKIFRFFRLMQNSKWVIVGFQLNPACKKAAKTVKTSLSWVPLMTVNQSYIKRVFSRIKFDKSDRLKLQQIRGNTGTMWRVAKWHTLLFSCTSLMFFMFTANTWSSFFLSYSLK